MKRFRDQLQGEGLAVKKAKVKDGNKRLSIESAKPAPAVAQTPNPSKPTGTAVSPSVDQSPTPRGNNVHEEALYVVEHIDVSEEVRRRLNESRLRRLMDTPSTSHKRKRDAFDDMRSESATETDDDGGSRAGYSGSELEGTPTKRIKSIGSFSQVGKRKENGVTNGTGLDTERFPDREDIKRRKV